MDIFKETEFSSGDFKCPHCKTELTWQDYDDYEADREHYIDCPECKSKFKVELYVGFNVL